MVRKMLVILSASGAKDPLFSRTWFGAAGAKDPLFSRTWFGAAGAKDPLFSRTWFGAAGAKDPLFSSTWLGAEGAKSSPRAPRTRFSRARGLAPKVRKSQLDVVFICD